MGKSGQGKGIRWLRAHVGFAGDECLIWPMFRDPDNGYCRVWTEGRQYWAHRLMCELAHGPAPSPAHEAAHSCGHGHEGCVHPQHLSWKTRVENQADRYVHNRKPRQGRHKLTPAQVAEIRSLEGKKKSKELAAMFGVSSGNIRQILLRQTWTVGGYAFGGSHKPQPFLSKGKRQ